MVWLPLQTPPWWSGRWRSCHAGGAFLEHEHSRTDGVDLVVVRSAWELSVLLEKLFIPVGLDKVDSSLLCRC